MFAVQAGQTTDFIDRQVHKMIIDNNAYPSPLTYGKFLQAQNSHSVNRKLHQATLALRLEKSGRKVVQTFF